jgi:hypothetical protein
MECQNKNYLISTDKTKINIALVHNYLCYHSYWAEGIPVDVVQRSIENSLCFAVYNNDKQVGFARVISDFATYAYLADLFIVLKKEAKDYPNGLCRVIIDHPQLQGLRRVVLATKDAHGLYAQFGFTAYPNPDRLMTIGNPDIYKVLK